MWSILSVVFFLILVVHLILMFIPNFFTRHFFNENSILSRYTNTLPNNYLGLNTTSATNIVLLW